MKVHSLKTWPDEFKAIIEGRKHFEFRRDDGRAFEVGDVLHLREFDPHTPDPRKGRYTGRSVVVVVDYLLADRFDVPDGFVIMSIRQEGEVAGATNGPASRAAGEWVTS